MIKHKALKISHFEAIWKLCTTTIGLWGWFLHCSMFPEPCNHSGKSRGGPVPYQRGLVHHQSPRLRYSNKAVNNSDKAVTVIREAVHHSNHKSYKIIFILSGGLSSHCQKELTFFALQHLSAVCPTKSVSLDKPLGIHHELTFIFNFFLYYKHR